MRLYRIRHVRHDSDWRYDVIAASLNDPDVDDVINTFAGSPAGLEQAKRYVLDVQARNAKLGSDR